jgi:hypothetical protein
MRVGATVGKELGHHKAPPNKRIRVSPRSLQLSAKLLWDHVAEEEETGPLTTRPPTIKHVHE